MTLLAPVWLWLVVPWLALVVYLLRATGRDVQVPFIDLWKDHAPAPAPRRTRRLPPLSVLLILSAMLLAILAAAKPAIRTVGSGGRIAAIVDAGATMPARALRSALEQAHQAMLNAGWSRWQVDLLILPGDEARQTIVSDWPSHTADLSPVEEDTAPALNRAIRRQLATSSESLLVISNQRLPVDDDRLIHIVPDHAIANAGIAHAAIGLTPRPQLMLRVLNQSPVTTATLRLTLDDAAPIEQLIDLPAAGETRDLFIDLPHAPDVLAAHILIDDDLPHDNRAMLRRRGAWARIEPLGPLPAELSRMLDIYSRHRPARDDAPRIVITADPARLPPAVAGAVALAGDRSASVADELSVTAHPITRDIAWDDWLTSVARTTAHLPDGLQPLVTSGDDVLLAIRDTPARQVWLAFDTTPLTATPQYVILWTNILTWLGGEGVTYTSDAAATFVDPPPPGAWRDRLAADRTGLHATTPLSPMLLVAAIVLAVAAIALLPRRRIA